MRTTLTFSIATLAIGALLGCSGKELKRAGYETLHNISDYQNVDDPRYDPGRPSFETYQQQREEYLREQRPATDRPAAPLQPSADP